MANIGTMANKIQGKQTLIHQIVQIIMPSWEANFYFAWSQGIKARLKNASANVMIIWTSSQPVQP